jgi:hypothetical protein
LTKRKTGNPKRVVPTNANVDGILKGALIGETYTLFADWDFRRSAASNFKSLYEGNTLGTNTTAWLHHIGRVLQSRFSPEGRDRALVELAQRGCDVDTWTPLLLWHIAREPGLIRSFFIDWLFGAYEKRAEPLRGAMLHSFLRDFCRRSRIKRPWADSTVVRVAAGLLKMASDFGILQGVRGKKFASYQLPEQSLLYLLHAMRDDLLSPSKVIEAPDWRLFLMRPADVERELLRLHQFRKLEYHAAGSIVHLSLPCKSSREYAERMVA